MSSWSLKTNQGFYIMEVECLFLGRIIPQINGVTTTHQESKWNDIFPHFLPMVGISGPRHRSGSLTSVEQSVRGAEGTVTVKGGVGTSDMPLLQRASYGPCLIP